MHNATQILRIREAATIADCSVDTLLHHGAMGGLVLLVPLPAGMVLRLADDLRCTEAIGYPSGLRIPNLLALKREYCLEIELTGHTTQCDFPYGYRYGALDGEKLIALRPFECDMSTKGNSGLDASWRDPASWWTVWRTYLRDMPEKIEITTDRLFVFAAESGEVRTSQEATKNMGTLEAPENPHYSEVEYLSENLRLMDVATQKFWGARSVRRDDRSTHPKTGEIVAWFIAKGLSRSLAERAASLIRPEFAGTGRPPGIGEK